MTENNVIPVEFGKSYNEATHQLARLMALAEEREKALSADPAAFLREASDRIIELQRQMRCAAEACFPVAPTSYFQDRGASNRLETVSVLRSDYDRWKACEAMVEKWR